MCHVVIFIHYLWARIVKTGRGSLSRQLLKELALKPSRTRRTNPYTFHTAADLKNEYDLKTVLHIM